MILYTGPILSAVIAKTMYVPDSRHTLHEAPVQLLEIYQSADRQMARGASMASHENILWPSIIELQAGHTPNGQRYTEERRLQELVFRERTGRNV